MNLARETNTSGESGKKRERTNCSHAARRDGEVEQVSLFYCFVLVFVFLFLLRCGLAPRQQLRGRKLLLDI